MKKLLIIPLLACLFGFTYGYKNNAQTMKPDLVVTGATVNDITGFGNYTGFVPYTGASKNVNLGVHTITGTQLISSISIGTAPLVVTSTTPVANLSVGGNAGTATALAANGTNCSSGQAPLGVDASGNSEGCFTPTGTYSLPTATSSVLGGVKPDGTSILNTAGVLSATAASVGAEISGSVAAHAALTATHGATGAIVGTTNSQILTNKTINDLSNYVDADAIHFKIYNNSGGALTRGQAVYGIQWNSGAAAMEVSKARANSASTMPAMCLVEDATIANGAVGECRILGALNNANTNAWSDGAALYVSAATAGLLTTTRPTGATELVQRVGTSVRQSATVGVIAVFNPDTNVLNKKFLIQSADADLPNAQAMGTLATGIVKNTTTTGVQSIAVVGDFPTLNQNTTGSAAKLTTARAINGVDFDGTGPITINAVDSTARALLAGSTSQSFSTGAFHAVGGNATGFAIDNNGAQYTEFDVQHGGVTKVFHYWDDTNTNYVISPSSAAHSITLGGKVNISNGGSSGKVICWKTATTLGYCSSIVDITGGCTCN